LVTGSVGGGGGDACICKPHCWQYANPSGVCVPHRGHEIMPPWARAGGAPMLVGISPSAIGDGDGGIDGGTVGSGSLAIHGVPPSGP
jgi:hypothetical protein